ncbi:alpha/beta hydrolase [Nocardioides marmoriginsengisoli]|uniref:Alpha/beta hydrolase n=1 Tax=Nocardioides marmoriginsengisoli TaxID=661483 RepID=A0A3N0CP17_9ACTN|nr:alpha/beta hydrolase [Nocardioides marmoriginsengisoli]RNL65214.1 alpha/beta hydrolase [Nocardioides marmoriginsengisoli]
MPDRLTMSPLPDRHRGTVLMLHGGAEHGDRPVDHRSLALRRTRSMFEAVSPAFAAAGFAVGLLRFSVKGWQAADGGTPSPVRDARLAVRDLRQERPDVPIVLLGHSMGARTAAWVADEDGVLGVVGLAPWFPSDDPVEPLTGKRLVAVHGSRDRITSPKATRIFVERAAAVADEARYVELRGRGHYMLAGIAAWNRTAVRETLGIFDASGVREPDVRGITSQECNQG